MTAEVPPGSGDGSLTPAGFEYVQALAKRYAAVSLDDSKHYLVRSRLMPLARREGFDSVPILVDHLRARPFGQLHVAAVEALVTTETSFFRDFRPFEALRTHVLPELIRLRRGTSRSLTIWCAACSSGQEAHSISLLLREHFPMLEGWSLQLLASDISNEMLERARSAVYQQHEVNRGLPARLLVRYFDQEGTRWRLKEPVRSSFRFFQHNLAEQWLGIPPVDVLFLRNVLIYFDVETRQDVLRRARRVLRPEGYLVLGAAETTLNLDDSYRRVPVGDAVFYQIRKDGR